MDAAGAAIATVFAQAVSVVFSVYKIRKDGLPFRVEKRHLINTKSAQKTILKIGTPVALQDFLTSVSFLVIMAIINNITMLAIVLTGSALIREREHGTVEHLLVMPVTPFEIMMAKIWSMGLVVLVVSGLSLILMVQGVLQVPIEGSIPLFMLGVALSLFATTSIGIFMGTVARSMPQLGLLMILVLLPLQMLSGGSTPRESMPQAVQDIMLTMPTTHFVSLAQAILYRGADFAIVWPQFLTLLAIGGVFFTIALLRFRKTIGEMA